MKTFDVAIIGGGVIGVSIAFELAAEKLRVVVLDRQQPGYEASYAAAGMLSPAPDSPGDVLLAPFGRESLNQYPEFIASLEGVSGRSAKYVREGALEIFLPPHGEPERDSRVFACRQLGIAAEAISIVAAREREKCIGPLAAAAAWLPEEASVEPQSLMIALLLAAQRRGVEIRPDSEVTEILCESGRCTGLVAGGENISASHVVVAAGSFSSELAPATDLVARYAPTRPVRGQMLALRARGVSLRCVLRSERGYLVPRHDGRIVAGSTSEEAGFDKRVTPEGIRQIFEAAVALVPELASSEVLKSWAGLRPGTPDNLPILGPTDIRGLLIATGHYRNGILLAPATAKLIREWIVEGHTGFNAEIFSPLRFIRPEMRSRKI